jgi:diguanylate cyclase (GGDEF)-like protein
MRAIQVRSAVAVVMLAATLMVGGLAYYVSSSQSYQKGGAITDFGQRSTIAAKFTSSTIRATVATDPRILASEFGGSPSQVNRALVAQSGGEVMAAVLGPGNRVLASWPAHAAGADAELSAAPDVRAAAHGTPSLSNLLHLTPGGPPVIRFSQPFATAAGRRVFVTVGSARAMAFAATYLASAPGVEGGRGYLIDGNGIVLASSQPGLQQGQRLPQAGFEQALVRRRDGSLGSSFYAAAPIGSGTSWSVVLLAPGSTLLAGLKSSNTVALTVFGAFLLAVIGLLAAGALALRNSARLARFREREKSAQSLAHERLHDGLTGLPNRALFLDRVDHALQRAERTCRSIAVLFVDLDHFKRINDSLGHACGDELLDVLAARLSDAIRPLDTLSRFGADEFLILCEELEDVEDASRLAVRIQHVLDRSFCIADRDVHLSCCVGIAIHAPSDRAVTAATLIRDADSALYSAKAQGPGSIKVFDQNLHAAAVRRLDTEVALRGAIINEDLAVHYQPIVALPGGELRGVEALVRWPRPGIDAISPIEFIMLAEESGLIHQLGVFVLATALRDVGRWRELGVIDEAFSLSVNVSRHQLMAPEFPATVERLLANWQLPASDLCLEITESAVANDPEHAQAALRRLSEIGVQLAIDDFGVGQSSLEQLVRALPVDVLKLDRTFVADMEQPRERAVVAAVAPMASALGMSAIAEGVETARQAQRLSALGYPFAQGYYFGRPMQAARFVDSLQRVTVTAA